MWAASPAWSDVTHVAAFSVGVVAGAVLTLRCLRYALQILRRADRRDDSDS